MLLPMEFVLSNLHGLVEMGIWCVTWCIPFFVGWLALAIVFLVYFYVPCWGVRRIPGPPTVPIVGHLPLLEKFGPDVLRSFAKEYGPIFRFHMGRQPLVIVADPELCREVGIKKFKDIKNRSIPSPTSGSSLHEKGLFLTKDSRWSSMRNAIVPFYQPTHLATLIPTVQSIINSATADLATLDGPDVNLSHLSLRMAIDVIGRTAFDVDFGLSHSATRNDHIGVGSHRGTDDDASAFLEQHIFSTESLKMDLSGSLSTVLGLVVPFLQKPCRWLLRHIPGTADHKMHVTNEKMMERINKIIERKEKDRGAKDFLSAILNARDSSGLAKSLFTNDYVGALAYEHLLAGSATTAFTLSSAVYLLCTHPHVEKKLLEEIDRFVPIDRLPTAEDLQTHFPYLDQVVKETMRYYTVSPLVARETTKEIVLAGYVLPKGTWVWLALGVLAKDAKNFRDPNVFRPERFDSTNIEDKRRHPYSHIPFGIGPRTCIGQRFTIQEIKLALIHLYRHYVFKLSPTMNAPPEIEYGMVLNFKHGIMVRVEKRVHHMECN